MTFDTLSYVKRLEAAGVPRAQAEAHAEAFRDDIVPQLVTSTDLGHAVDRLETRIDAVEQRLGARIDGLDVKIDGVEQRLETKIEAMMWKHTVAIILTVVAVGGLLLRFAR